MTVVLVFTALALGVHRSIHVAGERQRLERKAARRVERQATKVAVVAAAAAAARRGWARRRLC